MECEVWLATEKLSKTAPKFDLWIEEREALEKILIEVKKDKDYFKEAKD